MKVVQYLYQPTRFSNGLCCVVGTVDTVFDVLLLLIGAGTSSRVVRLVIGSKNANINLLGASIILSPYQRRCTHVLAQNFSSNHIVTYCEM